MIDDAIFNFRTKLEEDFYPKAIKYIEACMSVVSEGENKDSVGSQYSNVYRFGDFLIVKEDQSPDYIFKLKTLELEGQLWSKELYAYRGYDSLEDTLLHYKLIQPDGKISFDSIDSLQSFLEWNEGLTQSSRRKTTKEILESDGYDGHTFSVKQHYREGKLDTTLVMSNVKNLQEHVRIFNKINSIMCGLDVFKQEFVDDMDKLGNKILSLDLK